MTKQELEQIKWYRKEIEMIDKQIEALRQQSLYPSGMGDGMPKGNSKTSQTEQIAIKIYELTNELNLFRTKLVSHIADAYNCIRKVPDSTTRMVAKYRCIDGLSFEKISAILDLNKRTVMKRYDEFILTLEEK